MSFLYHGRLPAVRMLSFGAVVVDGPSAGQLDILIRATNFSCAAVICARSARAASICGAGGLSTRTFASQPELSMLYSAVNVTCSHGETSSPKALLGPALMTDYLVLVEGRHVRRSRIGARDAVVVVDYGSWHCLVIVPRFRT